MWYPFCFLKSIAKMIRMKRQLNFTNKNLLFSFRISFGVHNKIQGALDPTLIYTFLLTLSWAKIHFIQPRHLTARYEANPIHFPFSTQNIFKIKTKRKYVECFRNVLDFQRYVVQHLQSKFLFWVNHQFNFNLQILGFSTLRKLLPFFTLYLEINLKFNW